MSYHSTSMFSIPPWPASSPIPPLSSLSSLLSASPERSSSPPLTPSSSTSAYHGAYIHCSSPTPHHMEEESIFSSYYRQTYSNYTSRPYPSLFMHGKHNLAIPSARDASPNTDAENEDEGAFASANTRSTFFTVSAERGRWKTDPMPRKSQSQPRTSKSESTSRSPLIPLQHISTRSASEPAPVQESQDSSAAPPTHVQCESEEISSDLQSPVTDSGLPCLITDKESTDGQEELLTPLSPLPPSSPFSSLSACSSPKLRLIPSPSSSPLLLSSPLSSPISEYLSLDEPMQGPTALDAPSTPTNTDDVASKDPALILEVVVPDVPVKAVLGPRENVVSTEARPRAKSQVASVKKRKKEDQPRSESKKRRRVEGTSSHSHNPVPRREKTQGNSSSPQSPTCKTSESSATRSQEEEEIRGMLIECMALSRASSLPVSSLYRSVMQTRPALKAQNCEDEWLLIFRRVLEAGRETGIFGKVESSGKDDRDRPLEPQWFYVPEKDEDQERAALIKSMMPRPGKRNETKKYKQYYYRPLDKISRWDSEDFL